MWFDSAESRFSARSNATALESHCTGGGTSKRWFAVSNACHCIKRQMFSGKNLMHGRIIKQQFSPINQYLMTFLAGKISSNNKQLRRILKFRIYHYRTKSLLPVGILGLSHSQKPGPDHGSGLHCDEGGGQVPEPDHGGQPALADRFYLHQGDGLGLVLPLDGDG